MFRFASRPLWKQTKTNSPPLSLTPKNNCCQGIYSQSTCFFFPHRKKSQDSKKNLCCSLYPAWASYGHSSLATVVWDETWWNQDPVPTQTAIFIIFVHLEDTLHLLVDEVVFFASILGFMGFFACTHKAPCPKGHCLSSANTSFSSRRSRWNHCLIHQQVRVNQCWITKLGVSSPQNKPNLENITILTKKHRFKQSHGGFHKWGYPQSSSIFDWDFFRRKTIQRVIGVPPWRAIMTRLELLHLRRVSSVRKRWSEWIIPSTRCHFGVPWYTTSEEPNLDGWIDSFFR